MKDIVMTVGITRKLIPSQVKEPVDSSVSTNLFPKINSGAHPNAAHVSPVRPSAARPQGRRDGTVTLPVLQVGRPVSNNKSPIPEKNDSAQSPRSEFLASGAASEQSSPSTEALSQTPSSETSSRVSTPELAPLQRKNAQVQLIPRPLHRSGRPSQVSFRPAVNANNVHQNRLYEFKPQILEMFPGLNNMDEEALQKAAKTIASQLQGEFKKGKEVTASEVLSSLKKW